MNIGALGVKKLLCWYLVQVAVGVVVAVVVVAAAEVVAADELGEEEGQGHSCDMLGKFAAFETMNEGSWCGRYGYMVTFCIPEPSLHDR